MTKTGREPEKKNMLEMQSLAMILEKNGIGTFKYYIGEDRMLVYNGNLEISYDIPEYLSYLRANRKIRKEERLMLEELVLGRRKGPIELHLVNAEGIQYSKRMDAISRIEPESGSEIIIGSVQDVTGERYQQEQLLEQIQQDPLTSLYNQRAGKERINE